MSIEQTIGKMKSIRLSAMATSYESRISSGEHRDLNCDEFVTLLIDDELSARKSRKYERMVSSANLKPEQASLENLRFSAKRNLSKKDIREYYQDDWVRKGQNVIITGPTGTGKTYLSESLILQSCKQGLLGRKKVYSILLEEIRIARAMGKWLKYLTDINKIKVLVIDDFLISKPTTKDAEELLTILEERVNKWPTIITSQYPQEKWHERIEDPTVADAICDRLLINSNHIKLKGESQRKQNNESVKD